MPTNATTTTTPSPTTGSSASQTVLYYNPNPHSGGSPCIDVYQPSVGKKRAVTYTFVMRVSMVACGTPGFFAADVAAPAGATNWDPSTLGMQFLFVNSTGYAMATDGPSCDPAAHSNVYSGVGSSSGNSKTSSQASLVASPNGCDGTVDSEFSGTYNGESVECAPYFTSPTPTVGSQGNNNTTTIVAAVVVVLALLLLCCLIALFLFIRRRRSSNGKNSTGGEDVNFQFVHSLAWKDDVVDPVQAINMEDLDIWNESKKPAAKTEPQLTWDPAPAKASVRHDAKTMRAKLSPATFGSPAGDVKVPFADPNSEEPEFVIQTFHNEAVIGEDEEDEDHEDEEEEDEDDDEEDDDEEDEDEVRQEKEVHQ